MSLTHKASASHSLTLTSRVPQEAEVGANPVQIEVGEFDEAIEIVEDVFAESKFTTQTIKTTEFQYFVCLYFMLCVL